MKVITSDEVRKKYVKELLERYRLPLEETMLRPRITSEEKWAASVAIFNERRKKLLPLLQTLPKNYTDDDLEEIIEINTGRKGNNNSLQQCNECKRSLTLVVEIGDTEVEHDYGIAWICLDCLEKAVALAKERKPG